MRINQPLLLSQLDFLVIFVGEVINVENLLSE